jgi:hypothetical protein
MSGTAPPVSEPQQAPAQTARAQESAKSGRLGVAFGLAGAVVAVLLGILTFGVQATVGPHNLPIAVGSADPATAAALSPILARVRDQGGDAVTWHAVNSRAEAENLLQDKTVYAALLLTPSPSGLRATILTSGAINPGAAQLAQPVLTNIAEAVTAASRAQGTPPGPPAPAVETVTLHPASAAGRVLPLAASGLLYLTGMIAALLIAVAAPRITGRQPGSGARITSAVVAAIAGTAAVLGFALWWDATIPLTASVAALLLLIATGFALLQSGILRWLGPAGMAILAPLYLMAPAVAGQVPELLNPAYRAILWSWTPFRFSTEGLRSLLYQGYDQDVRLTLWIFATLAALGLLLLLIPRSTRPPSVDPS